MHAEPRPTARQVQSCSRSVRRVHIQRFDRANEPCGSLALPITNHFSLPLPLAAGEIGRIAGGKRFLERFVHFFFQMPIFIFDFLVGSIRAHGIRSTNPHLFQLQESRATTG